MEELSKPSGFSGTSGQIFTQELTPPPDIFAHIKPCSHIKLILNSKVKNDILDTYKQALYVSQLVTQDRTFNSKKDGSEIAFKKLLNLKSTALKCTECKLNNFHHNFFCLQCPHVGCFTGHNHAYSHFEKKSHIFAVDGTSGLLFCFKCGDYVNDSAFEEIRLHVFSNNSKVTVSDTSDENYYLPSPQAISALKGFINLGSTCYMSSILQTLIHNPFVKYYFFEKDEHFFNCGSNYDYHFNGSINADNACITCSVDLIFKKLFTDDVKHGFGMTNLLLTSWYKRKAFSGSQEQDAHEFWQFLMNEFHADYERIMGSHNIEDCNCITHSIFAGSLESSIRCDVCGHRKITVDPMIDLSLEMDHLDEDADLYTCLDLFTKEEQLDTKYHCQSCNKKNKAFKSFKLQKVPPVMAFQLKRFKHNLVSDTFVKIETDVKIPLYLNINGYTTAESEAARKERAGDQLYELFALVCHIGSVNTGHYVVYIKDGNGQWLKFDDSIITLIPLEEISTIKAYLVYYIVHRI